MIVLVSAVVTVLSIKNLPSEKPKKEVASDFERLIRGVTFVLAFLTCLYIFDVNSLGFHTSHVWLSSFLISLAAVCTFASTEDYIYKKDSYSLEEESFLIGAMLYQCVMIFLVFVAICTHLVRF